jgi:prepilin-type N-terminal cleavage/methylation domain-containing protein
MTPTTRIKRRKMMGQRGFSLMQLIITVAVVSIVSTIAYLGITSARQRIRLTNSSRVLASYVEKARVDSVRRHPMTSDLMAGVQVLDRTTYRVKMDFDGNGTVETRDVTLDSGVVFATDPIALVFDWRGRLVDLPLTEIKVSIAMQWGNDPRDQRIVDVTRSGDVTIDSDVYLDDVPNVNVNVNGLTGIDSGSTVNGNNSTPPSDSPETPPEEGPAPPGDVTDPPPPPADDGGVTPIGDPNPDPGPISDPPPDPGTEPVPSDPPANPTPTPCLVTVTTNPSPLSIPKRGSAVLSFSVNPSGSITYKPEASNIEVSQVSATTFTVKSLNNTRGNFTLAFTTPCGAYSVSMSITN